MENGLSSGRVQETLPRTMAEVDALPEVRDRGQMAYLTTCYLGVLGETDGRECRNPVAHVRRALCESVWRWSCQPTTEAKRPASLNGPFQRAAGLAHPSFGSPFAQFR